MIDQCVLCGRQRDDWKLYHVIRPDKAGEWQRVSDRLVCGQCIRSVVYGMFKEAAPTEPAASAPTARSIIQTAYDRLVEHWGNDGSTLKDDFEYVPDLNLIRDMHRWLQAN